MQAAGSLPRDGDGIRGVADKDMPGEELGVNILNSNLKIPQELPGSIKWVRDERKEDLKTEKSYARSKGKDASNGGKVAYTSVDLPAPDTFIHS